MARKTYTTRAFKAVGRKSCFFGTKVESKYKGGGFTVTYSSCQRGKQEAASVTVELEGHGLIGEWIAMDIPPSTELAKNAAAGAFRQHFGIWNGEPHDYEGRMLGFCKCEHPDPHIARKRGSDPDPALAAVKRPRRKKA